MIKKNVLITGGANGIGNFLAWNFLMNGHNVVISDISETALAAAASILGPKIEVYPCDVSKRDEVFGLKKWFLNKFNKIDILVNNAGIGSHEEFENCTDLRHLFEVNFWGAINHIDLFLPIMKKQKSGHIVNICSGQVFFNLPTWGGYTTTKAALSAASEVMYHELKKYKINITTVYPFMVDTGFYKDVEGNTWAGRLSMRLLPWYSMTPEKVAKIIYKAIQKKKRREMVSYLNYIGQMISVVPPISNIVGKFSNFLLAR